MGGDDVYAGFRITELWAWTTVDPADDQEGVLAFLKGGVWIPMIAADRVRLDDLRPLAERQARTLGVTARLRRFVPAEDDS